MILPERSTCNKNISTHWRKTYKSIWLRICFRAILDFYISKMHWKFRFIIDLWIYVRKRTIRCIDVKLCDLQFWNHEMAAILNAILNFFKCSMMPTGHHSASWITSYSLTDYLHLLIILIVKELLPVWTMFYPNSDEEQWHQCSTRGLVYKWRPGRE